MTGKHLAKGAGKPMIDFGVGRFPVIQASPVFEGGRFTPKVIANEVFPVNAKVFREGHDRVGATVVVCDKKGKVTGNFHMHSVGFAGDDNWEALAQAPKTLGKCSFYIEGWSDVYHTWEHNAWIKVPAGQDIELMLEEGAQMFERWADYLENAIPEVEKPFILDGSNKALLDAAKTMRDHKLKPDDRLKAGSTEVIHQIWNETPLRELISHSEEYSLEVLRELSAFSAWYEFFPRSEGAKKSKDDVITSGTFSTATKRLQAVKDMGFDIIYLPPIHPIGSAHRKGKNNSLDASINDPGSPWAVGSKDGGHDAIHPELGTMRTFKNFVAKAQELGLEVSLDIALQCSPDHPWVKEHPEWFTVRTDGSIAYAENPPKKYQDIYPINFDNDPEGITAEVLRILKFWIEAGVTVFRIDNPHTKPVWFWQYVIADIKRTNPEIIWLAEAFTLPSMMKTLGLIGYDQSHSYFLWRNNKEELSEFLGEISSNDAFWFRSTLWPTTPDNLTDYLANGGVAAHAIRAVLAALGSTTWGIYAGYELVEDRQRQNADGTYALEHVDSEKYEIKVRNWKDTKKYGIEQLITALNRIRRDHQACHNQHSFKLHTTTNDNILAFSRHIPGRYTADGKDDTLIVIVNLDPHNAHQATVYLDWGALNLPESFESIDELTNKHFQHGREIYVDLAPVIDVAHVFAVQRKN